MVMELEARILWVKEGCPGVERGHPFYYENLRSVNMTGAVYV
jgi:hypothetical protein